MNQGLHNIKVRVVFFSSFLMLVTALSGCHSKLDPFRDNHDGPGQGVNDGVVQTVGIAAAEPILTDPTQRRATSRNEAIIVADYEMIEVLKGLHYSDGSKVENRMNADPAFLASIYNLVDSSTVTKTEFTNDDGALVTIQLLHSQIRTVVGNVTDLKVINAI